MENKRLNFKKCGFELVENLPFEPKGEQNGLKFFKRGNEFYVFDEESLKNFEIDFFKCCFSLRSKVLKLKHGEQIYAEMRRWSEERKLDDYINNVVQGSKHKYEQEFLNYKEEEFSASLGENKIYPAIFIQAKSPLWEVYEDFLNGKVPQNEANILKNLLKNENFAIFVYDRRGNFQISKHFTQDMSYKILRGKNAIGNLIEVNFGDINLLLECGHELDEDLSKDCDIEKEVLSRKYDAVLISHYHLDHAGLVDQIDSPIFMGKGCFEVLKSQKILKNCEKITIFNANEEFFVKKGNFEIKIKPILVDHSAYDSYMFLITADGRRLLYTGDFRANGRKPFSTTLKNLPEYVDVMICEATNMFSKRENLTELQVEKEAERLMKEHKRVFVFQAGTNIDRLVSFYKASKKSGKVFLIDSYVASITENLPNIPNVKTFKDVYCFWNVPKAVSVSKNCCDWRMFRKFNRGLGVCDIASPKNSLHGDLSNFTMIVRPSMLAFLKRINDDKISRFKQSIFDNSVLIYSLWNGYKEKDDVKKFLDELQKLGVKIVDLHASGHADKQTIDRLKNRVNPAYIDYVHYKISKK